MKVSILILAVLLTNVLLTGCASLNRADSTRMLDSRAEYEGLKAMEEVRMREAGVDGFRNNPVPVRTRAKVAAVWLHPHEMANRDYCWGSWLSLVVEPDQWILAKPSDLPAAMGIVDVTNAKPKKKKPRHTDEKAILKP